jgi:hypothetical protein
MLKPIHLTLPGMLLMASCVPPTLGAPPVAVAPVLAPPRAIEPAAPPPEIVEKVIAPGKAAEPFSFAGSESDAAQALRCLTAAVYYEARSETLEGQRAVAQVVLNRVRHPAFPKSVCGVVYQGSHRTTGCQFSFTCDGSLRRPREPGAWERAARVAANALAGAVYGPVGLATHYHTTAIRPWWAASLHRAITVGSHIFYRWRGDWGDPKSYRAPYRGEGRAAEVRTAEAEQAPSASAEERFGVRVHRSTEPAEAERRTSVAFGVRIHRSLPETPAATSEHPSTEAAALPVAVR